MKNNNKGFSLVELIVVIAIMAVLVGVLAPTLLRYVEKSRAQKDASAVSEVINAVEIACADEEVVKTLTDASYTVTVKNNAITGGTSKLLDEVHLTIKDADVKLTSKTWGAKTYKINITVDTNGATVAKYAESNWS